MSFKIVVLDGVYANPGDLRWDPLTAFGEVSIYERTPADEVINRSENADILIVNKIQLGAEHLKALPQLKLIIISATGTDNVNLQAAEKHGIKVQNVSGYSTHSVAQHVFSLLLSIYNQVEAHSASVKQGDWNQEKGFSYFLQTIPELATKTLTVVGYGQIGAAVAHIGKAFGMRVLIVSQHATSLDQYELVTLEEGFQQGDVISLHWPLTPERHGMVNHQLLSLMRPTSVLINTARGGLINEKDLRDALQSGQIAAAALDVMNSEPPATNHPLFQLSNCILTPHIAWASLDSRKTLLDKVFQHVATFVRN